MSSIAIGEGVNPDQIAVKACCDFVRGKRGVIDPPTRVVEKVLEPHRDLRPIAAYVLVRFAKRARPRPRLPEHLLVQLSAEPFAQHLRCFDPLEPAHGAQDVFLLPVVQVALGGQVLRNEPGFLVGVQGCLAACSSRSIAIGLTNGREAILRSCVPPVCEAVLRRGAGLQDPWCGPRLQPLPSRWCERVPEPRP